MKANFNTLPRLSTAALLFAAAWGGTAAAGTVTITGSGMSVASIPSCNYPGGPSNNCTSTAFASTTDSGINTFFSGPFNGTAPGEETFSTAFNNWNNANGDLWTLVNGGSLNIALTVNPFTASASANVGGISNITVTISSYTPAVNDPTLGQLAWSQALYVNDQPKLPFGQNLVPPLNTMDSFAYNQGGSGSGGAFMKACQALPAPPIDNISPSTIPASPANTAYCDPIYPFQNAAKTFFDGPQFGWPIGSFQGIALLSTVTMTTDGAGDILSRTLTVYNDGVNYGFNLSVPEPATAALLLTGLPALWLARRRRRNRGVTAADAG